MEFFTSPVGAAISFIFGLLGVVGVVITIYSYLRTRRDLHIGYDVQSFKIVTNNVQKVPKLQLTYDGNPIPNVTVSNVLIFNSGDVPIKQSEVDSSDPLAISIKEGIVLEAKVITNTTSSSPLNLELAQGRDNSALLLFDYLNAHDGATISVVHTGKTTNDVEVTGKVIGFGKIRRRRYKAVTEARQTAIFYVSLIGFSVLTSFTANSIWGDKMPNLILTIFVLMIPVILSGLVSFFIVNHSLPKELRAYDKDS